MSADDIDLFGKMLRIENKDLFIDLKKNDNGIYLKLSERKGTLRKTVLIPASGISKLQAVLEEAAAIIKEQPGSSISNNDRRNVETEVDPTPTNSVYVIGLTWDCTEEQLAEHFKSVAPVTKALIMRKPRRGGKNVSMGRGIVEFSSIEEAQKALDTFNNTEFMGRTIECRPGVRRAPATTPATDGKREDKTVVPNKVLVSNTNQDTLTDDLVEHFSVVGDVKRLEKVLIRGKFKGMWLVEYEEDESARDAILRLNDIELDGSTLSVRAYYQ